MRALAGVVLLGVVALAGCSSSSAEPQVLPSLSAAPSRSAVPSASPTGKDAPTPEGAAAFVRFFYAEISRGFAERDPSIVSALSAPTCKTCKLYIDSIAEIRDKNQRLKGGGFKILFAVAPSGSVGTARVDVQYDFARAEFVDASGKVVQTTPTTKGVEEELELIRVGGSWRIATVKQVIHK